MRMHSVRSILLTLFILAVPASSVAGIIFSIGIAPPPLPVYEQPLCPGDGYIWTPGYWAYSDDGGYFWVPGTWVMAPEPGFLWTPGWWGWGGDAYAFHEGYWGPHVGFYGGVDYGFGYGGVGYEGGYWRGSSFFYNRSVNNVTNITNVYNKTVVVNTTVRNVSYNGGSGGTTARANAEEEAAARDRHVGPIAAQTTHVNTASTNRQLFESTNHGRPAIAATAKPAEFSGRGVVEAKSAGPAYREPTARSANPAAAGGGNTPRPENNARPETTARPENTPRPESTQRPESRTAVHPKDLPAFQRPTPAANSKPNPKVEQNQSQLQARQERERQSLQQKQDQEHQKLDQRKASDTQKQQVEQKHQQQTQQLQQRHVQQQQKIQPRQQPEKPQERKK